MTTNRLPCISSGADGHFAAPSPLVEATVRSSQDVAVDDMDWAATACRGLRGEIDDYGGAMLKELNDLSWASTQAPAIQKTGDLSSLDFGAGVETDSEADDEVSFRRLSEPWEIPVELGLPDGSKGGFYKLMRRTRDLRAETVQALLSDRPSDERVRLLANARFQAQQLRAALASLEAIPRPAGWIETDCNDVHQLLLDSTGVVRVRLEYEKNEMSRDICYLESGEDALLSLLRQQHHARASCGGPWVEPQMPCWEDSVACAVAAMSAASACDRGGNGRRLRNFITDRDGTINNYCDRYASSVQSAYNAVWLGDFARRCSENTVILTAAPLGGRPGVEGLVELCTMPGGLAMYAGSKGREYFDHSLNQVRQLEPLSTNAQRLFETLHRRLQALCSQAANLKFLTIGSGLQWKFGEVTIARNDVGGTVPEVESQRFLAEVLEVVHDVDNDGAMLAVHDTGTDVEIFQRDASGRPSFDKGDGVLALDQRLGLGVAAGPNLVCGDTPSDVPMVEAALRLMACGSRMPEDTTLTAAKLAVLFVVTPDQHAKTPWLAAKVRELCAGNGAHCAILPSPDVLVAALYHYTNEVTSSAEPAAAIPR
mmetsp:Transcript_79287/g.220454  ORF Transcript_79287/g.220454 Transcript_79287/m.220454 type:complete len:598 (+) Transcript_79287:72-1865(+)